MELEELSLQFGNQVERARGDEDLQRSPGEEEQGPLAGGARASGESGGDEEGHRSLLADPGNPCRACGEQTVDETPDTGGDQDLVAVVADRHADNSGNGHGKGGEDHRRKTGVGDALVDAKSNGHGSATRDQARGGMADKNSDNETECDGDAAEGRNGERGLRPVKGVEVGEVGMSYGRRREQVCLRIFGDSHSFYDAGCAAGASRQCWLRCCLPGRTEFLEEENVWSGILVASRSSFGLDASIHHAMGALAMS